VLRINKKEGKKEMQDNNHDGALKGINVVECAEWIAGPGTAAILADWGAEVIKVEPPTGDALRGMKSVQGLKLGDVNFLYELPNRNKRSIAIDLTHKDAACVFEDLIKTADVFVTNYRPSAINKMGLTYEKLKAINPRIIYASVSGFGNEGSDSQKPGYDYAGFWARAGLMAKLSETLTTPPCMRPAQGDNTTNLILAGGVVAALFSREKTGLGQEVSTSLYHVGVWVLGFDMQTNLSIDKEIPTQPRHKAPNPLWNFYQAKDLRWIQLVMIQSQRYWPKFCKAIAKEELENDTRFNTMEARESNCSDLISILDEIIASKTTIEWDTIFRGHDLIFERAYSISEITKDPQALANGFFQKVMHPILGETSIVSSPIKFSVTPAYIRSTAPQTGEHTEEILQEMGYDWDRIGVLKEGGIIP
jgi:crotonobetainyl-CoA:carnitine CoA-transferase CaiB-like acyl-CoA transferase